MTLILSKAKLWLIVATTLILSLTSVAMASQSVFAQDEAQTACQGIQAAGGDCGGGEAGLQNVIQSVINILLFIIGIAAVISLIIGGLRYVTSGGDQQAVTGAKNTIIYSIVGLVVAVLAYGAVRFVFDKL